MKTINTTAFNIEHNIIGKVTYKNHLFSQNKILVCEDIPLYTRGILALVMRKKTIKEIKIPILVVDDFNFFIQNDILSIEKDGKCQIVWDSLSTHNALYLTDYCNSKCIMCPQPMPKNPQLFFSLVHKILDLIDWRTTKTIGITGGEPTLHIEELAEILKIISSKAPQTLIHILTNARNLSEIPSVHRLVSASNSHSVTYAIPLYASIPSVHDEIVGVKGAFCETVKGVYNLAKRRQMIEIRVVITKQNISFLYMLPEFIYRNMPFVTHIALMSMEYTGMARENYERVFVDPITYKGILYSMIQEFRRYNMQVSIYNTPLCLLDKDLWQYAADSISTWKKTYMPICEMCSVKNQCGGVFETSFIQSQNIIPIP